jgi:hypothetical protein
MHCYQQAVGHTPSHTFAMIMQHQLDAVQPQHPLGSGHTTLDILGPLEQTRTPFDFSDRHLTVHSAINHAFPTAQHHRTS